MQLRLLAELTSAVTPAILCPITECNDNEQEEYAHSSPPREPAAWCEAGASAGAEWPWELRSESPTEKRKRKTMSYGFIVLRSAFIVLSVVAAGDATVIRAQGIRRLRLVPGECAGFTWAGEQGWHREIMLSSLRPIRGRGVFDSEG